MTKSEILKLIVRTTEENGGTPLGVRRFERETGVRHSDWFGIHWRSWGAAVNDAGFAPNTLNQKGLSDDELLRHCCILTREIGHSPTKGDIKLKKRRDRSFPTDNVFARRFGSYPAARAAARSFAAAHDDFTDVVPLLEPLQATNEARLAEATNPVTGFIYLVRHGARREYKIGKTFNPLRREGEIRLQLPEKLLPIHYIETDDPNGVEAYWHARFSSKRKEGEWFALTAEDVAAFKRWKRIV